MNLINFVNSFGVFDDLTGFDFVLSLNRSHDLITKEVETLAKVIKPSKNFKEYQARGEALYRKFSEKNETGGAKTIPVGPDGQTQQFVLEEATRTEFTAQYLALQKEFEKAIEAHTQNHRAYREALGNPAKALKLRKFSKEDLPKGITSKQLKLLFSVGLIK